MQIQYRSQLVELLRHFGLPLKAVEVGTAQALFSADLLNAGIETLFSVDLWSHQPNVKGDGNESAEWHLKNYKEAKERLKQFGGRSIMIRHKSTDAAFHIKDKSLGLAYIDCAHDYFNVKADTEAYWPKLVNGGIMAYHDYHSPAYGVKQAVEEFCLVNSLEINHIPENNVEDAGCWLQKI